MDLFGIAVTFGQDISNNPHIVVTEIVEYTHRQHYSQFIDCVMIPDFGVIQSVCVTVTMRGEAELRSVARGLK